MRAFARPLLFWSLTCAYAAVSLVGQGLHALSGCGHTHGLVAHESSHDAANDDAQATAACHCRHDCVDAGRPAASSSSDCRPSSRPEDHRHRERPALPLHDDQCVVCQFVSQGQAVAVAASLTANERVAFEAKRAGRLCVAGCAVQAWHSRAPPA
ncbi:MAG TPA: hypothetical protein VML55_24440 [Planctomycetaceae bacterium]|nr:hypothetical protein [Planctomycetaceae bacterium]